MPERDGGEGLHERYSVAKDGEAVEECFVLEPGDDPAAREALIAYAEETDNDDLAQDLREWVTEVCMRRDAQTDQSPHVPWSGRYAVQWFLQYAPAILLGYAIATVSFWAIGSLRGFPYLIVVLTAGALIVHGLGELQGVFDDV